MAKHKEDETLKNIFQVASKEDVEKMYKNMFRDAKRMIELEELILYIANHPDMPLLLKEELNIRLAAIQEKYPLRDD